MYDPAIIAQNVNITTLRGDTYRLLSWAYGVVAGYRKDGATEIHWSGSLGMLTEDSRSRVIAAQRAR